MRIYDIIEKKRFGNALTEEEIRFFVNGYAAGEIYDYQISALLMAICINGMNDSETAVLTDAMAKSGDMLDLSRFGANTVDKHSTGGVGDKTTLIVAPIAASLGCNVVKLSGRGLGHTGGTIDKLESIPGFRTELDNAEFMAIAEKCGLSVCGAGANIAPADKKLYALRDVTATVESIPLIVSSIMSKKLAGGAKNIVLDVKTGSGAFMKTLESSRELANRMVAIGKLSNKNISAVITNMDKPLGYCVGNALEVAEAVSLLRNNQSDGDLYNICVTLSSEMVSLSKNIPIDEAVLLVKDAIESGKAYECFKSWISLQGGDVSVFDDLDSFVNAKYISCIKAEKDCYITSVNASEVGVSAMMLGAGRASKLDSIDYSAGIVLHRRVGDRVKKGDIIAELRSSSVSDHTAAKNRCLGAITFSQEKPSDELLIYDIIR
ncbi:MAG: thymidine phosphorylase [Ruminococcaceae bacterium]|nr:thymidine phosphorylase [Oscillospiraceae bacterium]